MQWLAALKRETAPAIFLVFGIGSTAVTYIPALTNLLPLRAYAFACAIISFAWANYRVFQRLRQQGEANFQRLLRENVELKDSQGKRIAKELANLVSELEDNLKKALDPVTDRSCGVGAYVRPSTNRWKAVRNVLRLDAQLRARLDEMYAQVDRWSSIVESGLQPGMGSPELNRIVTMLRTEIPALLQHLRKSQDKQV